MIRRFSFLVSFPFVLAILATGCEHHGDANPNPDKKPEKTSASPGVAMSDVRLDFTLTKVGDHLHVAYTLVNMTKQGIYVADQLLEYNGDTIKLVPDRVIVTADDDGTVRFVRGIVETETTGFDHAPGAVPLAAGASHEGSADVPLPLTGWHNYGPNPKLPSRPKSVVLEIAYLTGDGIQWGSVTTADGTKVTVPQAPSYNTHAKLARSGPKSLP